MRLTEFLGLCLTILLVVGGALAVRLLLLGS